MKAACELMATKPGLYGVQGFAKLPMNTAYRAAQVKTC